MGRREPESSVGSWENAVGSSTPPNACRALPELCGDAAGHSLKQSPQLGQLHSWVPPEEHSNHHTSILHPKTQQGSELLLSPLWACSTCRGVRPCHGSAVSHHPRMGSRMAVSGETQRWGWELRAQSPGKQHQARKFPSAGPPPLPFPPLPVVSSSSDKSLPPQSTV